MLVQDSYDHLPRRAKRMSMDDYIYYLNYYVRPEIEGIVQARWPDDYNWESTVQVIFPEVDFTNVTTTDGVTYFNAAGHDFSTGEYVKIDQYLLVVSGIDGGGFFVRDLYEGPTTGTAKGVFRFEMPVSFAYIDTKRMELSREKAAEQWNYWIEKGAICIPPTSAVKELRIPFSKEIPIINDASESLPYEEEHIKDLLPLLTNGAAVAHFRDRRKAEDVQIYNDLFEQAKANIGVLSVSSL